MSRTNLLIIVGLVLVFAVIQTAPLVYLLCLDLKKGDIPPKLGDTTSALLFTLGLAWVWKKIYSRKEPDRPPAPSGQTAKDTVKGLLKILFGGFVGGLVGIGASVGITYLVMLTHPEDRSAGSIGGVLPMLFLPLGVITGMIWAGKKKAEEA